MRWRRRKFPPAWTASDVARSLVTEGYLDHPESDAACDAAIDALAGQGFRPDSQGVVTAQTLMEVGYLLAAMRNPVRKSDPPAFPPPPASVMTGKESEPVQDDDDDPNQDVWVCTNHKPHVVWPCDPEINPEEFCPSCGVHVLESWYVHPMILRPNP